MPSLFQKARDWLPAQMATAATSGNTLTLTWGGEVLDLTDLAWNGLVSFQSEQHKGARIQLGARDYIVPASAIVFGGQAIEPQVGMRFTETIGGVETKFEVLDTDTGEPAFRYSDPARTVWRIHTKNVK